MKNMMRFGSGIVVSLILFLNACKHQIPVPPDNGNPGGVSGIPGTVGRACSNDSVYFANDIYPLISSTCAMAGCHDAVTHKEEIDLSTYNNIKNYIVAGNASESKIYKTIIKTDNERMPPPPMAAWTTEQVTKLRTWINQGAKNNACDRCDTTDYRFSTAIKPLIQNKCQGCHNPASLGGGIDLSTYTAIKAAGTNGKLYGSINWSAGYIPMPQGGLKMPDCEIKQIRKWIDAGMLNN